LIDHLPEELSSVVLDLIRPKPGGGVSELLDYPEKTAGRLMNPNVFALPEDLTAGEAIVGFPCMIRAGVGCPRSDKRTLCLGTGT